MDGPGEEPGNNTPPVSPAVHARFLDTDGRKGHVSGALTLQASALGMQADSEVEAEQESEPAPVHWVADLLATDGIVIQANWIRSEDMIEAPSAGQFTINAEVPQRGGYRMKLYLANVHGRSAESADVTFHDFTGNVAMTGPGGDVDRPWVYGTRVAGSTDVEKRPTIPVYRDATTGVCHFDNGFVYVVDMLEEIDTAWTGNRDQANTPNDDVFQAFEFTCSENPHNTARPTLFDETAPPSADNIWSYSLQNDAMYYGDIVYRSLHNVLGEPPLAEKLRIRVAYGNGFLPNIFWDGAYANFTEGYPSAYHSPISLDILAHEIGHGVLNRWVPAWAAFDGTAPQEVKTAQEAFSDMTGFVVKYTHTGEMQWIHGDEAKLRRRNLANIITETGAVASYLEYADAGANYYLGIGMLTYPFYQLVQSRGVEPAYQLFVNAAKRCWSTAQTLPDIAQCVKTTAAENGSATDDIDAAFKTVKILLPDEGVLSHFTVETFKKRVVFSDTSRSTGQVTAWHWDFGDGNASNEASPEHTYAQTGEYNVTLTVNDNTEDVDTFTRTLDISEDYCAPLNTSLTKPQIQTVLINSTPVAFIADTFDYSANVIAVANLSSVQINIDGVTNGESNEIIWIAWLDTNDNGVYEQNEQVATETLDASHYGWVTALNLSAIPSGQTRYLRIAGRKRNSDSCDQYYGQVLDVRVGQAQ